MANRICAAKLSIDFSKFDIYWGFRLTVNCSGSIIYCRPFENFHLKTKQTRKSISKGNEVQDRNAYLLYNVLRSEIETSFQTTNVNIFCKNNSNQ